MSTETPPSDEPTTTLNGEPTVGSIGSLIREHREAVGITLAELAVRSTVSQGLLSQIERGVGNPGYLTLIKIAKALKVPVSTFFATVSTRPNATIVRANERRVLQVTDRGLVYELLSPSLNGRLLVIRARIPAGYSNESVPFEHEFAEETLHLLEGRFHVQVGDSAYVLEPGDSVTYLADRPHWFRNIGDTEAVVIASMTPPVF